MDWISNWKTKILSFPGRLTLFKAVLSSFLIYTMQTVLLPRSICAWWISSAKVFYGGIQLMKGGLIGFVGKEYVLQRRLEIWDYDKLVMLMMLLWWKWLGSFVLKMMLCGYRLLEPNIIVGSWGFLLWIKLEMTLIFAQVSNFCLG